jgi:hypothetical protein
MANKLIRETWADLDQADLRLLLGERIGGPGQYDGNRDVLHLPLAREKCRVSLTYKEAADCSQNAPCAHWFGRSSRAHPRRTKKPIEKALPKT